MFEFNTKGLLAQKKTDQSYLYTNYHNIGSGKIARLIFNSPTNKTLDDSVVKIGQKDRKVGDYVKFNIQISPVVYSSFCNVPRRDSKYMTSSTYYYPTNNKYNLNLNIGFNFLFGRSPYVKHHIGVNYLRTKGEFIEQDYSIFTSSNSHYISTVDFINLSSGIRFTIANRIHFEPLLTLNMVVHSRTTRSGSETVREANMFSSTNTSTTTTFGNESTNTLIGSTLSLAPRIAYEPKIKRLRAEIFYSYNYSLGNRLPWHTFGFIYFPFKKFYSPASSKKIKLMSNLKVNFELGITLNNGLNNVPEAPNASAPYENEYTATNKKGKIIQGGINFGFNIINGRNKVCKHILNLSYVESTTNFRRYSYYRELESSQLIDNTKRANYYTQTHYFSFSTGIRLILFKFINLDNSIAFNLPFYANNKITGNYIKEVYSADTNNTYKLSSYSESPFKETSNEILMKPCISFSPKISFTLKTKEQVFGIYFNLNFGITKSMDWHMIGITYYPFKKLR